ncbi:flagellar basal body-associated FliL family protein [Phosphitispora sp. TUW77]|uniref:flagellar basal body-associated FliL family protein n=1 Tax=Phosphitispora sp. TUW77 TaxID=3152361 RepID=UPI003AB384A1
MADTNNEVQNSEDKSSSGSGTIKLIIAGVAILILCAGLSFGVAMYAANSFSNSTPKGDGYGTVKSETIGTTYDAGEFITNLDSSESSRYIKVKIVLAFQEPTVKEEISAKLPQIQHTINSTLRQQNSETLSQPKAMEKLADLLKKNINAYLIKGNVNSVYFTSFVVQ